MRGFPFAALALPLMAALSVAVPLTAQGFPGTYSVRNAQGGVTTLVFIDAGGGKLGGTFSGSGNSFQVTGVVADDEATGVISGRGMALYFQAQVKGATLLLVLAEPGPTGSPNMATAQQVVMLRSAPGSVTEGAAGAVARSGTAGTAGRGGPASGTTTPSTAGAANGGTGVGAASAVTAQDRQLIQVLSANAWCAFSYSGSQTYSGSSGTTRTERVVLAADGRASSNKKSEFAGSGEAGSAVGSRAGGSDGFWKFANGVLSFSADGQAFEVANFKMTYNSNGYPIPIVNGKEYMMCQ